MTSVLTWTDPPHGGLSRRAERVRRLNASHHAMWNYTTYRDAIRLLGLEPDEVFAEGTTRLDPAEWADLGWLTCFAGPPASAVDAMRRAVSPETVNQYTPDLIDPLRDAAAGVLERKRDDTFEVAGAEGAQAAIALSLLAVIDPGDEVIVSDPGYFHIPSAIIAAGGVPVPVSIDSSSGFRLDPEAVEAAITSRTRAVCVVDPVNPYGTVQTADELGHLALLADRHRLLLVHDVTHAPLAIDPDARFRSLPALNLTENAIAAFSVSHCWGMAGARLGFLAGAPAFVRDYLRLRTAITRLNTNLVSQHGALAALRDETYLDAAASIIRRNLAHLEQTLERVDGLELAVRPRRGLAGALRIGDEAAVTAQELTVSLFARRVAVYPGDGLGETGAATIMRVNLSRPDAWAMAHLRAVLPEAVEEARSGRWREPVAGLLDRKGTARAQRLARLVRRTA
jgi:aspartate/methionine/tyrosine aminotransferase